MNRRRVRLAIGAITPNTLDAIDAAIRLARESGDPLDCLFVEETDLFSAAALPFTREMGIVTAAPRRFDARALAGALRRQAEQAHRAVAEAARRSHVAFTFDVARGRLLHEPLARAGADDVVVIDVGGFELAPAPGRRAGARGGPRLLAVVETFPQAIAMLRAALGAIPLARPEVWQRPPTGKAVEDLLHALEAELGRPLRRVAPPPHDGEPSVAQVVVQVRPRVLAIDRETLATVAPDLTRALRGLGITVLAGPRRAG